MHLQNALTLPFDDPRWMGKLLPLIPLSLLVALPVFGLIPLALLLGWLIVLIANIRQGIPRPIPDWRDPGQKLILGGDVLLVMILAHLPLIVIYIIAGLLGGSIGSTFYGLLYNATQLCCLIPLSLLYMLLMWIIIGLGVLNYSDSHKRADLYRVWYQWDQAKTNANLVSGWLIRAMIINTVCILLSLTLVGVLFAAVILWPMQGILLGELGRLLDGRVPAKKER